MIDNESARTGYTKLYHPRGPLVSLPVVGDTPAAMFAYVTAMLDAGFVVAAPGLEIGEEREMVSGVLRSTFERDGEITDIILLYAANEAMKYSFLKLYLNDENDVKAFESACGFKLDTLPIYEGTNKPERDGKSVALKYIAKLPKPVPVIFKQNPKWSEEESAKCLAAQKPYTTPKRVFVRWADAAPAGTQTPADSPPPLTDMQVAESAWKMRLSNVIGKDDMNKLIPIVKAITDEAIRKRAWTMCLEFAESRKWVVDKEKGIFRDVAEVQPPKPTPPVAPPPPPDESAVTPLVAAWQKRIADINLETFTTATLNDDMLIAFKGIGRNDSSREHVWKMLHEFANKYGCEFSQKEAKFVDKMP